MAYLLRNRQNKTLLSLSCLGLSLLLSFSTPKPAYADDLSVFTSGVGSHKPNILFVLDFSGSMKEDINGTDASVSGLPSKESILKNAVNTLLTQNESRINAGLSLFRWSSSGIKWPVSDLTAPANSIDPSIPLSSGLTSKDIVSAILNNQWSGSTTATVSALTEAALYFKGGNVSTGGLNPDDVFRFEPEIWNSASNRYEGGSHLSANPVTYTPQNAFVFNTPGTATSTCNDYTVGGTIAGESNQCAGITVSGCSYRAASSGSYAASEGSSGGTWSSKQHNVCTYTYPHSWTGANYVSPITNTCQKNIIVLISDGQPTSRWSYPDMESVLGTPVSACEDLSSTIFATSTETTSEGSCGPEIAQILQQNDQIAGIENSNVSTYTIGFNVAGSGQDYLRRIAAEGGGLFLSADQPADLTQALNDIINDILETSESFAELSIDIDRANFSDNNRVYFPLFAPSLAQRWEGNLKGYFIDSDGLKDINNTPATVSDASGTRFVDTAQSFWSPSADGNEPTTGGASEQLATTARNLYTFTGTTISSTGELLSSSNNEISVSNSQLTPDMMGIPGDNTQRAELIDWLHDAPMGDPLHTRAVPIQYANRSVVYLMTNQGLIHAIDASSPSDPAASDSSGGQEIFAFMPTELLTNLDDLRDGSASGPHIYGLDGGITPWHEDDNNDGIVNGSDSLLLVFGMRRGGSNYYALDVTDPDLPKLMWQLQGGVGDFADLAQSWSRMSLITVKKNSNKQRVLVFGGGYDAAAMDGVNSRVAAGGATVYMVDRSGNKIWSASHSDMLYSIPSDLTVIDVNDDGVADRIYVGDVGGQVWRVDVGDVSSSANFKVNRLADLGNDAFRSFYYRPSVSFNGASSDSHFSVVIGTGNRTNPLEASSDNLFAMLKDSDVELGPPASGFSSIQKADLYNATANIIGASDSNAAAAAKSALENARGWYVKLAAGEKSLSAPVTFEGNILATTFSPTSSSVTTDACAANASEGRYYIMGVRDAQPVKGFGSASGSGSTANLQAEDRSKVISSFGIPSSPVLLFPKGSDGTLVVVDRQTVDLIEQKIQRVYWHPK